MKKILSFTILAAAFSIFAIAAKAQVHYSYTYYSHPYELPAHVTKVIHKHYGGCHLVKARSYYLDDHIAFNLVFDRGGSYVEVFVDHHGHVVRRVDYAYNPVTYVWVNPPRHHHHHHYKNSGHHHKYYKNHRKHHYDREPSRRDDHRRDYSRDHQRKSNNYERRDEYRIDRVSNERRGRGRSDGRSAERYHSYARR